MRRLALVAVAVTLMGARASRAADGEGRSVVVLVEGADADAIAAGVSAHVATPNTMGDSTALRRALAARGTNALAPAVGNRARDAQLVKRTHAAMTEAHVDLAILVVRRKDKRGLHVWAIDASKDGAAEKDVAGAASASEAADAVWTAVGALVPAPKTAPTVLPPRANAPPIPSAVPSAPAPEPSAAPAANGAPARDVPAAAPAEDTHRERARALLVARASLDAGSRHFSYVDRITPDLRPYDLFAAPMPALEVEVYPLARSDLPVRGLGIAGGYARAVGIASADTGGTRVDTSWQRFDVGLRGRFDLGRSAVMGLDAGLGGLDFHFGDFAGATAVLPSVTYRFLRLGPELRVLLGNASIYMGGAYLPVLSTGSVGNLFPRATKGGIEARAGAAYVVAPNLEVSLGLGYTRFYYSLRPEPGDANVAGGALDEMAKVSLGLAYLLL